MDLNKTLYRYVNAEILISHLFQASSLIGCPSLFSSVPESFGGLSVNRSSFDLIACPRCTAGSVGASFVGVVRRR